MVRSWGFELVMLLLGPLLIAASVSQAGLRSDLAFIMQVTPIESKVEQEIPNSTLQEVSEIRLIGMGLIRFYQLFISSQDMPVCNFTLSCSHFGMKAIQQYGLFHGILITSDRLQRCNRMARKYYPIGPQTGLAIDYPVKAYYLGKILVSNE